MFMYLFSTKGKVWIGSHSEGSVEIGCVSIICVYMCPRFIMGVISLQAMNPRTIHTGDFMADFVQNSADMIEKSFRQTCLKGSEKR
jgi:hypothetical protein